MPRGACKECGSVHRDWSLYHSPSPCERCGGQVVIVGSHVEPKKEKKT